MENKLNGNEKDSHNGKAERKNEKENIIMYVCRRMKLCSFLLKKGFKYIKIIKDRNNPKYNCWLFENSPELKIAVEEYYDQIKK